MLTINKILTNLATLTRELETDLHPTHIDSTIPKEGGHTTPGPRPPLNLTQLENKITTEDELRDIIHQILKHANIHLPASAANQPLSRWCTWLSHNTHLINHHPEPDTIEQGLRTIEQDLTQRHHREPPINPHGQWLTIQQAIDHAWQQGHNITRKQIHHWRARGHIRAHHSLDGTLKYSQADIDKKLSH